MPEYFSFVLFEATPTCVIHGLARYSFFCFRSKRVDRWVGVEHEEYLEAVDLTSCVGTIPTWLGLPLTSLCDRPLLFVYSQVNNGVLYCLWIMKILIIMVLCCARFNYCIGFVFIV